jgi:hypothetical protein
MTDTMPIDWNDASQAIPHTVHLLDAMKEDLALSYPERAHEIAPVVSRMDDLLGEVERRMETRPDYFSSPTAYLDFVSMVSFWRRLLKMGASVPLETPCPY